MGSEFIRAADLHFGFLKSDLGYKRGVEQDREDVAVWYADEKVRISIVLQGGDAIVVYITPLEDGEVPDPFDKQFNLRLTKYALEDLVPLYDRSWSSPSKRLSARSSKDFDEVLAAYANAIRRYGAAALKGEPLLFRQLADAKRRRLINEYIEKWSAFVPEVCKGFAGSIVEYVEGVNERAQLQTFLQRWEGSRTTDPIDRLEHLDDRFLACTEPIQFRYGETWQLLPMPTARDWWRRPRQMVGQLREYFMERERSE